MKVRGASVLLPRKARHTRNELQRVLLPQPRIVPRGMAGTQRRTSCRGVRERISHLGVRLYREDAFQPNPTIEPAPAKMPKQFDSAERM